MILAALFALVAILFASVGQGGAPGYVAIMSLFGFAPAVVRPVALALTMLVAAIGIARFRQAGLLVTRDWLPFTILSIPCAVVGGLIALPPDSYRLVLAALLLAASAQMARAARRTAALDAAALDRPPSPALAVPLGGAIGLAAGITGIGGGLFVAWLMMSFGWAPTRRVAAAAQVSNFVTAAPALAGVMLAHPALPPALPVWAMAAALGGVLGAWFGTKYLPAKLLRYGLAAILLAAGVKLVLG
jgi:uncharacterized membrane protein YfcA